MDDPRVECNQCGRVLDEPSSLPPDKRRPCPVCGSMGRRINVVLATSARLAIRANAPSIEISPAETAPAEESASAARVRGYYDASLHWRKLEGDMWLLHVLNERGDVVDGGMGDDPEEALLEVYERLIPPK